MTRLNSCPINCCNAVKINNNFNEVNFQNGVIELMISLRLHL